MILMGRFPLWEGIKAGENIGGNRRKGKRKFHLKMHSKERGKTLKRINSFIQYTGKKPKGKISSWSGKIWGSQIKMYIDR